MEDILTRFVEITVIALYLNSEIDLNRVVFWGILLVIMQISVGLMDDKSVKAALTIREITCFALYCLYLIAGVIFAFWVPYFWFFLISFLMTSVLVVLRFSPPFILEKSGSGGIFRIMLEGWLWVLVHALAISDSPRFVNIDYLPVFLVFEAWYLMKELDHSAEDIQNKHITTGILMGRHGCFRIFTLLHIFSWVYIALDIHYGLIRGLPLIISPWALYQIALVRSLELTTVKFQAFLYYLVFSILTSLSLYYKP